MQLFNSTQNKEEDSFKYSTQKSMMITLVRIVAIFKSYQN